jgi:hypothetical protein
VRARITVDFLRGFLAAYIVHECYEYGLAAPLLARQRPELTAAVVVGAPLLIAIHIYVLVALLLERRPKVTFIILLLLALVPFLQFLPSAPSTFWSPRWHLTSRRFIFLLVHALSAIIAYIYYRRVCRAKQPNQTMQPTASPRTASVLHD